MADGKTHARIAGTGAVVTCIAAPVALVYGHAPPDVAIGAVVGAACGYFATPDLDIPHRTHEEWRMIKRLPVLGRLWAAYWAAYGQLFTHRGISHAPVLGTLTRAGYGFWWLVFVPWGDLMAYQYMMAAAFAAWCVQEIRCKLAVLLLTSLFILGTGKLLR